MRTSAPRCRQSGAAFSTDLSTAGLAGVRAHLRGAIDPDHRGAQLERFELSANGSRWAMARPPRADLRSSFRVDRLSMISGGQRLSFHGGVSRGALALAVEARSFDLASIPSLALPARLAALGLPG